MTLETTVLGIQQGLEELRFDIGSIDSDKIAEETARVAAIRMSERVRDAVIASPHINAPATTGPYESGPGPSMGTKEAWMVNQVGEASYQVRPHPQVRTRAIVLNEGSTGPIRPDGDNPMRFEVRGIPLYTWEVDGVTAARYWEQAFKQMEQAGEFRRIAENELRKEFERHV